MRERYTDIAVIGGGAAGMMCALRAAERHPGRRFVIIEKADRVGKKLLVTGNGRCNLTHRDASAFSYHGDGSEALINILFEKYSSSVVEDYFHQLGLLTYADSEGRVYPRTNLASSVLDVLRLRLQHSGIEELCGVQITAIRSGKTGYEIVTGEETIITEKLVLATGGRADYAGRFSDSSDILHLLGLRTTTLSPSLSPVKVQGDLLRPLKGVRADAAVSLIRSGEVLKIERGEVQFADGMLSGICVFNLSREANKGGCEIALNLLPDKDQNEVRREILSRIRRGGDAPVSDTFIGMFHKIIGLYLLKRSGVAPSTSCRYISDKEINSIIHHICDSRFICDKNTDFKKSQVTAGGVSLSSVNPHTFECTDHPGLYIIGEALDVDGDCGGYNLQFAWASGMCAGDSL